MPPPHRPSKLRRSLGLGGPLGIALALGVFLVGSSALSYRDARRTAGIVAERQGIGLIRRIESAAGHQRAPEALARIARTALEVNRPLGLTYVGFFERAPDRSVGALLAEDGRAVISDATPAVGAPIFRGDHVRMVAGGPPGMPPFGGGPPPDFGRPPDFDRTERPPGPPPGPRPPEHERPPPPPHHRPALIIEFEPIASAEAVQRALRVLLASSGAGLLLTAAAIGLALRAARDVRVEAEHAKRRHLAQLGEMSAVLAHELRNPLASLKGHAQLLAERAPEALAPRVERVVAEAIRLEQLTNDLLEFARSGAIDVAATNPLSLVEDAVQATDPARVDVVAGQAPPTHPLDAPRLRQVLVNLLENALSVTPAAERVVVTIAYDGGLVLTVRDHGPGIPMADRARVFEPFFTTKTRGTGLGLAVARRIVELHGGTIDVDDAPGGGALFRVYLPARSAT
jgi:two-component system sensor histidine kinase HydH